MSSTDSPSAEAEERKIAGNEAFAAKDYDTAIAEYSEAIKLEPGWHVYYSNRAAAYAGKEDWEHSLDDARKCTELRKAFMKGWYRMATAQKALGQLDDALRTCKDALKLEPDNAVLKRMKNDVKRAKRRRVVALEAEEAEARRAKRDAGSGTVKVTEEMLEAQAKLTATTKKLRQLEMRSKELKTTKRAAELTLETVSGYEEETPMYRPVGKMFLASPKEDVTAFLEGRMEKMDKETHDALATKRRLKQKKDDAEKELRELIVAAKRR
eukprot:PLAT16153.3.p2 GENE.PLAT16153.3~~PLAT16153.3.p2  ORF type:complete len:268 (-),score=141.86 PLAT16153.3:142-945(-)